MFHLSRRVQCETIRYTAGRKRDKKYVQRVARNINDASRYRSTLTVNTTRGVPSTSIDLKEALCEKIPIYYDLLRTFRRQHGRTVVSQLTVDDIYRGLTGINTMVRETSEIDEKYGVRYRGLTIPEVITLLPRHGHMPSAEAVFWLLLTGDVPTQEQAAWLIRDWVVRRQKRSKWWSGPRGGAVGSTLHSVPTTVTPIAKLSIALTSLEAGGHMKEAVKSGAMSHTYWEYLYEDSMDVLAILPAIVGLIYRNKPVKDVNDSGDWVHFLQQCLEDESPVSEHRKKSMRDFLRLYVTINADEDGGSPGAHVAQILGASHLDVNQALAAGALTYAVEPTSGTMFQYMDFQRKVRAALGYPLKQPNLKSLLANFVEKQHLSGYKRGAFPDSRYTALVGYVNQYLAEDSNIKLSHRITQIVTTMMKKTKGIDIFPEQTTIAAPVFQLYGLKDMKFNQVLLCMSRALGSVASMIWAKAMNAPVEHPKSSSTFTYIESLRNLEKKNKKTTYVVKFRK